MDRHRMARLQRPLPDRVALLTLAFLGWLNWKTGVSCIVFPPLVVFLFWFIPLLASPEEDLR